ncbi:MAG: acyl-CoA dehydrogenase family protein [SAR202 cluster bacterium]|nr:acyl-CoA dehydrogenase family protein [SAR202 cluster bacterium]MDP6513442.1 acyl-CoA dehydrogenase family protein [SAR202 cluster bacterium]
MDFSLPEDVLMIRDAVRQFVERELLPLEQEYGFEEYNLTAEKHAELVQKVKDAGLWGLFVPEEYGGPADIGWVGKTAVQEEIFATLVGHTVFGRPITEALYLCNDEQKERYLLPALWGDKSASFGVTEPVSGTDPSMMASYAVAEDGKYIVNGRKIFISGAENADFMLLYARLRGSTGRDGITSFLVDCDTPGFVVERQIPVIAMPSGSRTESPCEVSLTDVEIPARNVLGTAGEGWTNLQGSLGGIRLGFGARCVALAEKCLKLARDHALSRETFGKPLADRQAVQWMIADSAIAIESLRWITYHAAWKLDQNLDARPEISMLKIVGSEMLEKVSDSAMQIHGSLGVSKELPMEHIFRGARVDRIVDGPNEIHRFVLARNIIRGYWFPGY